MKRIKKILRAGLFLSLTMLLAALFALPAAGEGGEQLCAVQRWARQPEIQRVQTRQGAAAESRSSAEQVVGMKGGQARGNAKRAAVAQADSQPSVEAQEAAPQASGTQTTPSEGQPIWDASNSSVIAGESPAAQQLQESLNAAVPEAWSEIIGEAPVTVEEFKEMTLLDHLQNLLNALKESCLEPLRLLAKLCAVLVLAAAVRSFTADNAPGDVMNLLDVVVTLAVFGLCSAAVLGLMGTIQSALEESRTYISCFVPVFASVMASCGQVSTSLVYSGIFFGIAMVLADVLCRVGLPVIRILLALHAAGAVGSVFDMHSLTAAVAKWVKWLLTFCATVFAALVGLQSVLAQSADSLALKTGKFLVGSSIPVVGRAISDAMGGIMAGLQLLKGTVGFAAIAVLAAVFVPILLQCVVYHLVFTLAGMTAAATGSSRAGKLFEGCAQCVSLFISMTFFFCLLVTTTTMLMVVLGNGGG